MPRARGGPQPLSEIERPRGGQAAVGRAAPAGDALIMAELMAVSVRTGGERLYQFRSVAGAHQYRRLYRVFRRYVPAGGEVLDWGAGSGHFSYFLCRAGYRATGYSLQAFTSGSWLNDPSYRYVQGSERDPIRLPFLDQSFDAVASVGVLEHVRETGGSESASLGEIARVLRPGGVFVCFHFPNRYSLINAAARWTGLGCGHHLYRFTRYDIEHLAQGAGLALLEVRRYGFLPRNSCSRLPGRLRSSHRVAAVWNVLDDILGLVFSPICQNYLFVARKRRPVTRPC